MKRIVAALTLLLLPLSAAASPELALQWGHKAGDLRIETSELIHQVDTGEQPAFSADYLYEIERFAMTASRLSHWVDQTGKAPDLGCIFRGMASEGELQLDALDTALDRAQTRAALARLVSMFSDAEMIAVASSRRTYLTTARTVGQPESCAASADAALHALR
ncbi:MAG: hypothetical protein QNI84_04965 [Henriciella sp.]|nr:hypothetical protein [Henriciella sp.]